MWHKRIPKKLKLGSCVFTVKVTDDEFRNTEGVVLKGYIDHQKSLILLDKNMQYLDAVDTLLHECLHFGYYQFSLEQGDKEERVVSCLGTFLALMFKDNPKLVEFLNERG